MFIKYHQIDYYLSIAEYSNNYVHEFTRKEVVTLSQMRKKKIDLNNRTRSMLDNKRDENNT